MGSMSEYAPAKSPSPAPTTATEAVERGLLQNEEEIQSMLATDIAGADILINSIEADEDSGIPIDELAEIEATQEIEDIEFMSGRELDDEITIAEDDSVMRATASIGQPPMDDDGSEPLPHTQNKYSRMSDWDLAFGIWCKAFHVSRKQYEALLEVFTTVSDIAQLSSLPRAVGTLIKQVEAQLPLLAMRRKKIALTPEKLPTLPETAKLDFDRSPAHCWMYWFDPICMMIKILETPAITTSMHFGFAEFIDEPTEYWHSMSWASSVRSTCGKHARHTNGTAIFPSDMVTYTCRMEKCLCSSQKPHTGRVSGVGLDKTSKSKTRGKLTLLIQRAFNRTWAEKQLDCSGLETPLEDDELILVEDAVNWVHESDVVEVLHDLQPDYTFATGISSVIARPYSPLRIRRIANRSTKMIRPIVLSNPVRAELELSTSGRHHFENLNVVSVPFLCFIDGFGLYRNTYRTLVAVYLILASLPREERARRANILPLTLCPHGSDFGTAITNISAMLLLDKGITVSINGQDKLLCAWTLNYLGDMPQQNKNSGATVGCHRYLHPPWRPTPPKPPNCMLLYRNTKLLFLLRFYTFL